MKTIQEISDIADFVKQSIVEILHNTKLLSEDVIAEVDNNISAIDAYNIAETVAIKYFEEQA